MRFAIPVRLASAALLAGVLAAAAQAGQVRVDVTNFSFNPPAVTVNQGDHVVWVWTGGFHTVTSGNSASGVPNGIFSSGPTPLSGLHYSWESTPGVNTQYYCIPHRSAGMVGTVSVFASGVDVSEFRISEVDFGAPGNLDFVEIVNLGTAAGNLGQYRVSVQAGAALTLDLDDINVPSGGRVVLRLNQTGTNTQTELFFSGVSLGRTGSAALYVPNTVAPSLSDQTQIIDYVQWGDPLADPDQANFATAAGVGFWAGGQFAPQVADGHSIEFCGNATNHGPTFWRGIATPTPGGTNCTTSTFKATWGRLKTLYR